MTPTELETYVRQSYNATGDTFFSQAYIFNLIYAAQMELGRQTNCIREIYTTTTVSGTHEYAFPTTAISIARITYNGKALSKINMREDDAITANNQATTATGEPTSYYVWDRSIFLRPTPNAAYTLKVFSYDLPDAVTSVGTLSVPAEYHPDLGLFCLADMSAKDKNVSGAQYYLTLWKDFVEKAKRLERTKLRAAQFAQAMPSDLQSEVWVGW